MTRIIYADLLFFINLTADLVIIFLTGIFSGTGCRPLRMTLSAIIGAAAGTAAALYVNTGPTVMAAVIILPSIMCFTVFGKRSLRTFGELIFWFYFSSVILYGGTYAMASLISMLFIGNSFSSGTHITVILIVSVFLIYLLFSPYFIRKAKMSEGRIKAELFDGQRTYELTLLVDSGNLAKDPFSAKPVVIVSRNVLDGELVDAVTGSFEDGASTRLYHNIRPRVIPMKTVSGTALLYAFVPESLYIFHSRKRIKTDCIIAIDDHKNAFFGSDGIIPGSLLQSL